MILLMQRWMDSGVSSNTQSTEFSDQQTVEDSPITSEALTYGVSDHSYVADDDCQEPNKLFSFIQLILEFANSCLVSGIAHVLYPRLLQAQL